MKYSRSKVFGSCVGVGGKKVVFIGGWTYTVPWWGYLRSILYLTPSYLQQ